MATAQTIIRRALRAARVIDAGEALESRDAADALESLNNMLAEWHEAGIGLPDYSFADINTALASDAADAEAIALQLALRVAGEYGKQLMPQDAANAETSMARLRLRYFQPSPVDPALPSSRTAYDVDAG